MEIKTLNGVDRGEILTVFNESFSDYFVPLKLSREQLDVKMSADRTDLDLSVGVFDKGNLVAFILHGYDNVDHEKVVYNGGTGVIPRQRGAGLTKQMYQFVLPLLIENGIDRLVLEVISENVQAIKSYERSGFRIQRRLFCYKGEVTSKKSNSDVEIKELKNYNWGIMESFWDIHPTWQNSKRVVNEHIRSNISLGAYVEERLVGYLVYNPSSRRIQQIAVNKEQRQRGIGSALFSELTRIDGNELSIINVDESSDSVCAFLVERGLRVSLQQIEMDLKLSKRGQY